MPRDHRVPDLADDARNALTVAHGRLQMLRRKTDRGEVDDAAAVVEMEGVCLSIRRAVALLDALEATAAALPLMAGLPVASAPRATDD